VIVVNISGSYHEKTVRELAMKLWYYYANEEVEFTYEEWLSWPT